MKILLLILIALVFVIKYLDKKENEKIKNMVITVDNHERAIDPNESFVGHCQQRQIFTAHEWHEYKRMKRICDKHYLVICPKIRLLDIVEPKHSSPKRMLLMNKIKAKQVDFVICDMNFNILGVVELDDLTHDRPDRKLRDQFVDEILLDVGYTVIHARYINENTLDPIIEKAGT